jgi:hypothetical protein
MAGVSNIVDIIICHFKMFSIEPDLLSINVYLLFNKFLFEYITRILFHFLPLLDPSEFDLIENKCVNEVVIRQTRIPTEDKIKGYKKLAPLINSAEFPETTKAATVDSANEPNKSDPIPAISPTLSPTLSAIVAGFLPSSSAKSLSYYNNSQ